ncbi:NifB/NifX family molybdenum-iron cluster-binding protein [Anaerotalea alkaliphila]|uniref:Dinitrogenase iron-molybdenum cofactor n=1 Tax=Anaerotalea alkaliphila TaxID=2662126 RepID=A0A7X5HT69_9FIRM|nr:NifB/NifX family molybdenum-iron cluster-binding protein [Anaerotalea alkaliphila]NDL66218.1 dinitrogenase iron-molybdenum cofactor [Anaerotalea alkaliphila]
MKIAITLEQGSVSQKFGHCEGFRLCTVEEGKCRESVFVPNPGHAPGRIPAFLVEQGVQTVISGGMGEGALGYFSGAGVDVVLGVEGSWESALQGYLDGTLAGGPNLHGKPGGKKPEMPEDFNRELYNKRARCQFPQ